MEAKFKTFLASYNYAGSKWGLEFPTQDHEDAKARLAAMSWGQVDGELMEVIPDAPGAGLLVRLICWVKNLSR